MKIRKRVVLWIFAGVLSTKGIFSLDAGNIFFSYSLIAFPPITIIYLIIMCQTWLEKLSYDKCGKRWLWWAWAHARKLITGPTPLSIYASCAVRKMKCRMFDATAEVRRLLKSSTIGPLTRRFNVLLKFQYPFLHQWVYWTFSNQSIETRPIFNILQYRPLCDIYGTFCLSSIE